MSPAEQDDDIVAFEKFKQDRAEQREREAKAQARRDALVQAALKDHPSTMSPVEMQAQGFPVGHRYNPMPADHES